MRERWAGSMWSYEIQFNTGVRKLPKFMLQNFQFTRYRVIHVPIKEGFASLAPLMQTLQ